MADTIRNPFYVSPIGDALGKLTNILTSGPSEASKIKLAEEALKLKREREGLTSVADVYGRFGTPGFDRNAAMRAAVLGGYDPKNLAEMERYGAANTFGATDPRTTNAFVGAGGAYSSTAPAFMADQSRQRDAHTASLANDRYKFDNTPESVLINGIPAYVPRTGVYGPGVAPILSETDAKGTLLGNSWSNLDKLLPEQKSVLGADPATAGAKTPRNYILPSGDVIVTYDGVTDARTGGPLPAGGYIGTVQGSATDTGLRPPVKADLQGKAIALDRFTEMLNEVEGFVKENPTSFGFTGRVKGVAQDVTALAKNLAVGLGYSGLEDAVASIREKIDASGTITNPTILSGIFDPSLPASRTAYAILTYTAAEAIFGQAGRDVSDNDVKRVIEAVGDPASIFESPESLLARLGSLRKRVEMEKRVLGKYLPGYAPAAPTGAPLAAPAAPAAPPGGDLPVVNTPAEAMALPPGTRFRTPDGRVKVRP